MPQSGYTPIQLYHSATASNTPAAGNLVAGELALNTADGKLFYKDSGGNVQLLASKAGASGDVVGPASATDNALVRFDTTTGKLVQNSVAVLDDSGSLSGLTSVSSTSFTGALTGNASTATALQTARTLWGQSFDGTANVTGALTGVTDITASGNVTLSGGTANGVTYLNGSKVLTSGSALTFNSSAGVFAITDTTNGAALSLGAAGAAFTIQPNNLSGSNGVSFNTVPITGSNPPYIFKISDTEQMRLTSTGLGIGTSSPNQKLVVSNGGAEGFEVGPTAIAGGPSLVAYNRSGGAYLQMTSAALQHVWQNGSTEAMRLDASGNLGIGTTAPQRRLQVSQNQGGLLLAHGFNLTDYSEVTFHAEGITGSGAAIRSYRANNTFTGNEGDLRFYTNQGSTTSSDNATEKMRLDSSGNLGLGVTGPQAWTGNTYSGSSRLTVAGTGEQGIAVRSDDTNATRAKLFVSSSGGPWGLWNDGSALKPFVIGGYATEWMRLDTSGNLGIGTSSPGYKLDVRGVTASGNGTITTGFSYDTGGLVGTFSNHALGILTNGAVVAKFDTSGNLGLGVTPSAWGSAYKAFQTPAGGIGANSTASIAYAQNAYDSGSGAWKYLNTGAAGFYNQFLGQHAWYTAPSGTAGAAISFTQAMTLDASGNLLVGATSAAGSLAGIQANGANRSIMSYTSGGASAGACLHARRDSDGNAVQFVYGGWESFVGSIAVTSSATAYNTSSDYRLKNITGPITNSGAYIDSLNPVEGTWKADGSTFVGLIAHEVQEVSRTRVATGEKDGAEMQAMDYSSAEIIANLIAEVKSLRARVATLESN